MQLLLAIWRFSLKVRSHQNEANKSRYSRVVGRLNILSLHASFTREIHYTTDTNTRHGGTSARQLQSRCKIFFCFCKSTKMYIQLRVHTYNQINLSSIVVWDFLPPLVITSQLEQAPDWLTRREYPPKFRFFNSHNLREWHVKRSIRAV